MPLPQQVINQLSREPAKTPGWSGGVIFFSGALFIVTLLIYFGMTLAYEPYLNGKISGVETQIDTLGQTISPQDQTNLITFYSQISNLQSLLQNHVLFTQFLSWLEQNTEVNISYSSLSYVSNGQVTLAATAQSEADINQQIAIFQSSPQVESVVVTDINQNPQTGTYQFSAMLTMDPSIFVASSTSP